MNNTKDTYVYTNNNGMLPNYISILKQNLKSSFVESTFFLHCNANTWKSRTYFHYDRYKAQM